MKLQGSYTFDASREEVWDCLMDPDVLSVVTPGSDKLEEIGENHFQSKLTIKIGPVKGHFSGSVQLEDLNPPESYVMKLEGQGPAGHMHGHGSIRLEAQGATTIMHYDGEAQVGGKIAAVGQRLIDAAGKKITKQSLDNLAREIQQRVDSRS